MTKAIYRGASVLAMALLLALMAQPASARFFGEPAADLKKNEKAVGVSYASMVTPVKLELDECAAFGFPAGSPFCSISKTDNIGAVTIAPYFKYGVSDTMTVSADFGSVSFSGSGSGSGTEFGAMGKMTFSNTQMGGKPAKIGALAAFHTGSGADVTWTDINIGAGVSVAIDNKLNVYGAGTFTSLTYTAKDVPAGAKFDIKTEAPIGIYGGASYAVDNKISLGGEYHLLSETGFAVFGQYKF
jgi:hypothetical protein